MLSPSSIFLCQRFYSDTSFLWLLWSLSHRVWDLPLSPKSVLGKRGMSSAPFDLVFANILKGPLIALAPDMAGVMASEGYAILSGLLNEQADEVIEVYARSGINLHHRESIGDWTTLVLRKMN